MSQSFTQQMTILLMMVCQCHCQEVTPSEKTRQRCKCEYHDGNSATLTYKNTNQETESGSQSSVMECLKTRNDQYDGLATFVVACLELNMRCTLGRCIPDLPECEELEHLT